MADVKRAYSAEKNNDFFNSIQMFQTFMRCASNVRFPPLSTFSYTGNLGNQSTFHSMPPKLG